MGVTPRNTPEGESHWGSREPSPKIQPLMAAIQDLWRDLDAVTAAIEAGPAIHRPEPRKRRLKSKPKD